MLTVGRHHSLVLPQTDMKNEFVMPKYIFLDNWVLSRLTSGDSGSRLVSLLKSNNYTGLITSLSMVELYNPGWEAAPEKDRTVRAIDFLSKIACVIVDPHKVFRSELHLYPYALKALPVELDLQALSDTQRAQTLLQFMRRDILFLKQGKDIKAWYESYETLKNNWLRDAKSIVDYACGSGSLKQNKKGGFIDLKHSKEGFLLSLDLRHTDSTEEKDEVLAKIIAQKSQGNWLDLITIRMTSLCFWYTYVETDPANMPPHKPSDIGDYYHIGLIPYCSAFTIDNSMLKLVQRFREQQLLGQCELLNKAKLITRLSSQDAPY
jgi:hypothetical protein